MQNEGKQQGGANPQVALITGANVGIGLATAKKLAGIGYRLYLACRDEKKTLPVIKQLQEETKNPNIHFLPLDLSSLKSVRECVRLFEEQKQPLHVLLNNAGLAGGGGKPTAEGLELTIGVNYVGHFLLTILLLPKLRESQPARIVHVSSKMQFKVKEFLADKMIKSETSTVGTAEYAQSKLLQVIFSNELARRLQGTQVTTNSLHPGVIASEIWRKLPFVLRWVTWFMRTTEQGAATSVYCATSPDVANVSGSYFDECKKVPYHRMADDLELAKKLWALSVEWAGVSKEELAAAGVQDK